MGMNKRMLHYFFKVINLRYKDTTGLNMCELGNQRFQGPLSEHIQVAKTLFECLGFSHTSVDINGEDGALPLDLTKPITDASLIGKFDIVTNVGTSEHVVDQAMCFENIDRLCKDGGIIINISPYGHTWGKHGECWYGEDDFLAIAEQYKYTLLLDIHLLKFRFRNNAWQSNIGVTFVKGAPADTPIVTHSELSALPYYGRCD